MRATGTELRDCSATPGFVCELERDHGPEREGPGSGVWFLLFGLSFTLECATAALTVGNQERLGL